MVKKGLRKQQEPSGVPHLLCWTLINVFDLFMEVESNLKQDCRSEL